MGKGAAANEVPSGELLPFASCCCAIYSCYNKFPDCCGIYSNTTCCCLQQELTCCKCDKELMDEDECCTMYQGKMACLEKPGCCKGVSQVCCIDGRGALPCDDVRPQQRLERRQALLQLRPVQHLRCFANMGKTKTNSLEVRTVSQCLTSGAPAAGAPRR